MIISKKNNFFITLLLFATTFNSYNMEQPVSEQSTFEDYIEKIGNILLGEPFRQEEPFTLPPEDQNKIMGFLLFYKNSDSLEMIGQTINSLAQVNQELHKLINNTNFCLQLIKYLAQRFNCSDETAAATLQTKEAKYRLDIQKQFEKIFWQDLFNANTFNNFYEQYGNYIDLNFTYKQFDDVDWQYTPLMCVVKTIFNSGELKVKWLLSNDSVNVNCTDMFGITPLMACVVTGTPQAVSLLCHHPAINLNQKNKQGETALMLLCKFSSTQLFNLENMKILLDAGADPEILRGEETALDIAEDHESEDAIELIQDAIEKKHLNTK